MCKFFKKLMKVLMVATGLLFFVYFWNLDQKLMSWLYKRMNDIFDRKKVNVVF